MTLQLVLFNALSVAVVAVWIGFHCLKAMGRAYGNADPATGPGDVTPVFILVGAATVACVTGSFLVPGGRGPILALVPVVLALAGQGWIALRERANRERHHDRRSAERAVRERVLERIPKSYILNESEPVHYAFRESFLTHDTELDVIIRIDVGFNSEISAFCVGRVNGGRLELFADETAPVEHYRKYLDREGGSVFDRYTVGFNPDQDHKAYRLDRFES